MDRKDQIALLKDDIEAWNAWRAAHPEVKIDLRDASLSGKELMYAVLNDGDLFRADLTGADLTGAKLIETNLCEAILKDSVLTDATLDYANLRRARLTGAQLDGAALINADLSGAELENVNLRGADLIEADLTGASLKKATCNAANFRATLLIDANLEDATLKGANFAKANLTDAILTRTDLARAFFGGTKFVCSTLREATGLKTGRHDDESEIDRETMARSGDLDASFLRGCGKSEWEIALNHMFHTVTTANEAERLLQEILALLKNRPRYYSCFISYSRQQSQFANRLYESLRAKEVTCSMDRIDLLGGGYLDKIIAEAIEKNDRVLLCCSHDSLISGYVEKEINLAFKKEQAASRHGDTAHVLIPLDLDGYVHSWSHEHGKEIQNRMIMDFKHWKAEGAFKEAFNKLLQTIKIQ